MWHSNCRRMHNLADWISGTVMGGCVGRSHVEEQGGTDQSSTRTRKHGGRNEPLKKERPRWKSEGPMTEGQLRSKRAEFWDTAPAFDGRKEVWDALHAAALAAEAADLGHAQAIVDGAGITLPHGSLTECYDELGNRYQLPAYTLGPPLNLISQCTNESAAPEHPERQAPSPPAKQAPPTPPKQEFQMRVRLSSGRDVRLVANMADPVSHLKKQLEAQEGMEASRQRWFFSGQLLTDKTRLHDTRFQRDFVMQVVVNQNPPGIAP